MVSSSPCLSPNPLVLKGGGRPGACLQGFVNQGSEVPISLSPTVLTYHRRSVCNRQTQSNSQYYTLPGNSPFSVNILRTIG